MYVIFVHIDTDDDAMITFEGKSYCFYGEDLRICQQFETVEECYEFLRKEIIIEPGYKVSEVLREWIEEFIEAHKQGKDWCGVHGNQTVDIAIRYCRPSTPGPLILAREETNGSISSITVQQAIDALMKVQDKSKPIFVYCSEELGHSDCFGIVEHEKYVSFDDCL